MIKKIKKNRILVRLYCTDCLKNLSKGIFIYFTSKNRKNTLYKLKFFKFCPYCYKHTLFKEKK